MMAILVADCVSKRHGERQVLSSASLRAVPGELRVLLGRNGIGKSTLLKIAAGWIQPDSGAVQWDGVARLSVQLADLAREGLFYLPDHDLLSSAFTVGAQLEMLRRQRGGTDSRAAARRLGVESHLSVRPQMLSGGERRRSEVAAAIAAGARCLLADEPYRGVAPADAEVLTRTFRALAREGVAVVVTGHEVPTLLDAADQVTWCTDGTTYELGAPGVAVRHERFRREYLGTWY